MSWTLGMFSFIGRRAAWLHRASTQRAGCGDWSLNVLRPSRSQDLDYNEAALLLCYGTDGILLHLL